MWIATWIATLAAAAAAGRASAPSPSPSAPVVAPVAAVARPVIIGPAAAPGLTIDDVRAAVRAELDARAIAEPPGAPELAAEPPPADDPTALAQALDLVSSGAADGVWSDEDRDALRPIMGRLRGAQPRQVMAALFPLINDQRVRVETHGAPL